MFICIAPFPTPKFHITAGMYSVCMHSFFQNIISKNSVSIHWNRSAFKVLHFMLSLHCTQRSDTAFLGAKLKIYCNPIRHIMLFVPLRQNFLVKGKSKLWSQKKNPQTRCHVWKVLLQLFEESQICTNTKMISPLPFQQCFMEIRNDKSRTQNTDKNPLEITCTKTFWIGHMKFLSNDFSFLCGFFP